MPVVQLEIVTQFSDTDILLGVLELVQGIFQALDQDGELGFQK